MKTGCNDELASSLKSTKPVHDNESHETTFSEVVTCCGLQHQGVGGKSCSIDVLEQFQSHSELVCVVVVPSDFDKTVLVSQQEEQPFILFVKEMNDWFLNSIIGKYMKVSENGFANWLEMTEEIIADKKQRKCLKSWRFKFKKKRSSHIMIQVAHQLID